MYFGLLVNVVVCGFVLHHAVVLSERDTRVLLGDPYSEIMTRLEDLSKRLETCETANQCHAPVAFKAHLSQSVTPSPDQRIIFDDVQLNLGNAYHPYLGGFITPYNGTYLFSVSICSVGGHYVVLDLMRNKDVIGRILAGDPGTYDDCSSETTIAELKVGDDVYVQHHQNIGDYIHYQDHTINSFTGTLLQRM